MCVHAVFMPIIQLSVDNAVIFFILSDEIEHRRYLLCGVIFGRLFLDKGELNGNFREPISFGRIASII